MPEHNNYQQLIQKIDAFIRKFYMNKIIKGLLISVGVILFSYTFFTLLEHYYFNQTASTTLLRKILFYSFIGLSSATLGSMVLLPMANYFRLGKVISHAQAAQIIGKHFEDIDDKLLNVIQLKAQLSNADAQLIDASIQQKSSQLNPIAFNTAINLKENKKHLRIALPPLFLILLLVFSSNIIEDSTKRLINNSKEFSKEALFSFELNDPKPQVIQFEDYTADVYIKGEAFPNEVFIEFDNYKYKLEKVKAGHFRYTFKELRKDTEFRLYANEINSDYYEIDVLEKPQMSDFTIKVDYPAYTERKDETIQGTGDLMIPVGTSLEWLIKASNTDQLSFLFPNETEAILANQLNNQEFYYKKRIRSSGAYKIFIGNKRLPNGDSLIYSLTLIPDLYPTIDVKSEKDSLDNKLIYFAGEAGDDYGIKALNFVYQLEKDSMDTAIKEIPLEISGTKQTTYEYILNVRNLSLKPGDKLSYYFEVYDNDGINGSKSSKTQKMYFEMPTMEALKAKEKDNNEAVKNDLEDAIKKMKKLGEDVKNVQNRILQKKEMNWQDRKELEKLIQERDDIEKEIQNAQDNLKENMDNQEFMKVDEELNEKQEMLQKLFDELLNDEMKDLFKEMEEMLNEMDQEKLKEQLDEIKMSEEEMEKELDRMLELFKKLEVEKMMEDVVNELEELAKEEEALSEETEQQDSVGNNESEDKQKELEKKQEEIEEKFDELMDKMEDAKEKNDALENPMDMENEGMEQQKKDATENMKNSSKQLNQRQNKKASKSQKNAAQKMKEMSESIQSMMQMNQMEQMEQDIKSMRQILENLVDLSFDQEDLLSSVNKIVINTPSYVKLVQDQDKIKDDFKIVEDSLQALSKRVFQLEAFITEKVTEVKKNLKKSVETLEDRKKRNATVEQQFAMKGLNDLALMLNETMQQMQQQMAQQMPGEQMCEKPGEGQPNGQGQGGKGDKPGINNLRQLQDQLNKQLDQMKENMKKGMMPGSKKFAEMAAKQAAIRKALQKLKNEQKNKNGGKDLQKIIDEMDKVETDLVNKRLPNNINKRQQDILTRLLEAENADRERELDEKRKAESPDEFERKMPPSLEEYLKKRKSQVEMFKTVSPVLKPYYKKLVEQYFRALN